MILTFLIGLLLAVWVASSFPSAGPSLEQRRILGDAMKFTQGRWPKRAIREVWSAAWRGNFKKEGFIQDIAKKYNFKKFKCLNPFLTKYILTIFDEEIIPRIEYKYNYKENECSDKCSICANSKSLTLYRKGFPSVIQCSEHNSLVYTSTPSMGSNT